MPIGNISPRQFGATTRPVPMPTTVGSFGSGSSGMRPAPMPTRIGSFGSGSSGMKPVQMPTRVFGR